MILNPFSLPQSSAESGSSIKSYIITNGSSFDLADECKLIIVMDFSSEGFFCYTKEFIENKINNSNLSKFTVNVVNNSASVTNVTMTTMGTFTKSSNTITYTPESRRNIRYVIQFI